MKKLLTVLVALTLVCGIVLLGCSKKEAAAPAAATSSAGGEKVIELWHIQTTEPFPTIIQGSVDRWLAKNPGYKVNISPIANDSFKDKIAVAIRSNQAPDIFHSWSGGTMEEYADNGIIVDLTPYMNDGNAKGKYLDAAISQVTYKDKIWGVPIENVAIALIYYNKDLFAKYGIAVPKTLPELEAACDKLKANGIIPFSCANKTQWTGDMYYQYLATRYGGTAPFQAAMRGTDPAGFSAKNFVDAGAKIQDWVKKGYFNDGINSMDEDSGQSRQLLYNEQAAMYVMGSWATANIQGENPDFYPKLGVFSFPGVPGAAGNPNTVVGTMGDNFYHVASASKYPKECFEIIQGMLDDTAVPERIKAGRIPPLKGIKLDGELPQQTIAILDAAPDLQFWYDQSLNPQVTSAHLIGSQELFGLSTTPEAAAKQWADAQKEYLSGQ
ncbi:MAG: extracellular solute-binding protein [Spirochaetaceae bacterium]|jgi:raffinose/stachyose/melibiose transport system substrate-binding protein|nr:extracellular solute-binding protein [Spirochaetaceae bacterium]